jgi:two-component system cell cycle sensor histidine kinase/response regulator CckA
MPSSAHPTPAASQAEPAARKRVLIVEDDPEAALFATLVLGERGRFEVTHTPDPAVALVLAASGPWDLVLTDMDLPVMSGMELLAALRELAPRVPVLLVTACPSRALPAPGPPGRPAAATCSRPDGLLVKPFRAEQLLSAAVTLALGGRPS